MTNQDHFQSITSADLSNVTGGGTLGTVYKGAKAAYSGAKTAYKAVRPLVKEGSDLVKEMGAIGAAGYGIKKGWDYMTGHGGDHHEGK